MLAENLNRDADDVALFEIGAVFSGATERVDERPSLAFGATGHAGAKSAFQQPQPVDFYLLKGAVEELLSKFSARSRYFDAFPVDSGLLPQWLHPGRAARAVIDGLTVGYFGQLHPSGSASPQTETAGLHRGTLSRSPLPSIAAPTGGARTLSLSGSKARFLFHLPRRVPVGRDRQRRSTRWPSPSWSPSRPRRYCAT